MFCLNMVSLLDVLSLPSCGWSSKENIIKKEVLRGFGRITSGTGVLINQDAFNTIISTFIEKFRRRRMGRDKFIHHEKTWLENQQLLRDDEPGGELPGGELPADEHFCDELRGDQPGAGDEGPDFGSIVFVSSTPSPPSPRPSENPAYLTDHEYFSSSSSPAPFSMAASDVFASNSPPSVPPDSPALLSADLDKEMEWEEVGIEVGMEEEVVVQIEAKSELDMYLDLEIAKLSIKGNDLADCVLICEDGGVKWPRSIVALAFPRIAAALKTLDWQEEITVVLAEVSRKDDVCEAITRFLARGLDSAHRKELSKYCMYLKGQEEPEGHEGQGEGEGARPEVTAARQPRAGAGAPGDFCMCNAFCRRKSARAKTLEKPYSMCLSRKTRAGRVEKKVAVVQGRDEATAIIGRLHRKFPELELVEHGVVTNLDLVTLIRDCRLSYNTIIKLRWWIFNQVKIKKTNLLTIPPARTIFRDAEAAILPAGMTVDRDTMCASVPLQALLDKTVNRLMMCTEVAEHLVDGGQYCLLVKSGTDGQSGRGSFSWKGKKVEDNKSYNGAVSLLSLREDDEHQTAVWLNPRPAGSDFQRPYLMSYEPETPEMVLRLHRAHMADIAALTTVTTNILGKTVTVRYRVECTMHDGKEVNILTKDILRTKQNTGPRPRQQFKHYADPNTIGCADCNICLIQGVEISPAKEVEKQVFVNVPYHPSFNLLETMKLNVSKTEVYNYNTIDSFNYNPVLFDDVKHLGAHPMHDRIRVGENIGKSAEAMYAATYLPDLYFNNPKTKKEALKLAREHFQTEFKEQLGVKYFFPDPKNGGNSNTGPSMKKIFHNPSISAKIFEISPVTMYRVGVCCDMVNRTKFVKAAVFDKFARAALSSLLADLGSFANISGTTHSLLCHGALKILWAQEEVGVALGDLSENSIEMGNKTNLEFRKMFSRKSGIANETSDIFKRRMLLSDPYLILEGSEKQEIRVGNIRGRRQVKQKEVSFCSTCSFASTVVWCPWTPGGELAARWRELEASTWPRPYPRDYRFVVIELGM